MYLIPAFVTTILYSLSALFAQRTARVLGGISANFWRLLLAVTLLGLWSHLFGVGMSGKALPWFLLSGFVGFGIGDVTLFQALPRLGSRLCMLIIHCLAAPTAALVEYFWLGVSLNVWQVLCIGVSLFGVAFALAPARGSQPVAPGFAVGLGFGFTAMLGQAISAVLSRKGYAVVVASGYSLDGVNAAYQRATAGMVVSALVYGIHLLSKQWRPAPPVPTTGPQPSRRTVWIWVICNALAGPVLGVSCFQWAVATNPTGIVLPIVALTPLVIIPFAHWMEGERTTRREIAGGVIAVIGVAALTSRPWEWIAR